MPIYGFDSLFVLRKYDSPLYYEIQGPVLSPTIKDAAAVLMESEQHCMMEAMRRPEREK